MEGEALTPRRSSRSRSQTPMVRSSVDRDTNEILSQGEAIVKLSKLQTVKEMVIEENLSQDTEVLFEQSQTIIQSSEIILETHSVQNQESKKSINLKIQNQNQAEIILDDEPPRRSGRKKAVNGSQKKTKKTTRKSKEGSVPITPEKNGSPVQEDQLTKEVAQEIRMNTEQFSTPRANTQFTSPSMTRNRTPRTPIDPEIIRKVEAMSRGEVDASQSKFVRFYKPAGEWWNVFPKTDNTYSPLSKCRYELAPGVYPMPNLSRRSLQSAANSKMTFTHQSSSSSSRKFQGWLSNVDSDNDDIDEKVTYRQQRVERQGVFKRITTSVWFYSTLVITTILSFFAVIYANTIGKVVGCFSRGEAGYAEGSSAFGLFLKPVKWVVSIVRRLLLLDTWLLSAQEGAQEGQQSRRRPLILLLLLLLLGLPLFMLYAGGYELKDAYPYVDQMKETVTGDLGTTMSEGGVQIENDHVANQGFFSLIADGITYGLLQAQNILSSPMSWISDAFTGIVQFLVALVVIPVNWILSFFAWFLTPILWVYKSILSISQQELKIENDVIPPSANIMETPKVYSAQDIELLAHRVLQSAAFRTIEGQLADGSHAAVLTKSHSEQLASISNELKLLKGEMKLSSHQSEVEKGKIHHKFGNLERQFRLLQLHHHIGNTKSCCDNLEEQVSNIVAGLLGASKKDEQLDADTIKAWMKSYFVAQEEHEEQLAKLRIELSGAYQGDLAALQEESKLDTQDLTRNILAQVLQQLKERELALKVTSEVSQLNLTHLQLLRSVVHEELMIYDADKTNMADFALETAGGTILSTRCTESYDYSRGYTTYWNLLWTQKVFYQTSPRTIIQPSVQPGECWAFKGATGYAVIELSARIHVLAVTMEHVPRSLTPRGKIDSAPRDFSVWGLNHLSDKEPLLLGKFRYEDNDKPLQSFQIEKEHGTFKMVELVIESNHGNMEYTCVYRFRVHGYIPDIS